MHGYQTRFVPQRDASELINLYHLARTALSVGQCGRYDRMLWASKMYAREHPEVSATGAYKDLDGLLA